MNKPRRPPRRQVDGVVLFDKSEGMSSNAALQKVRWLFNAAKGGHTGTLDPMATGLLPLCLGEATKFSSELLNADKVYQATIRFGIETDTADADGVVIREAPVAFVEPDLRREMIRLTGEIDQVPPMYSAIKRDGKPLYEYARQGIELERDARRVNIYRFDLLSFSDVEAKVEVACSKGTYIRTLAADLGRALGCGAHLTALRRTRIGSLDVTDAVCQMSLESESLEQRDSHLMPVDALLSEVPKAVLTAAEAHRVCHGQGVRWNADAGERWRYYSPEGHFLGLGVMSVDGWLNPKRLVITPQTTN